MPARRHFALPVSAFRAADFDPGTMPDTSRASSILFVIDTTNAKPGEEGSFTIQGVELRRVRGVRHGSEHGSTRD